jgi:hypothetical protein
MAGECSTHKQLLDEYREKRAYIHLLKKESKSIETRFFSTVIWLGNLGQVGPFFVLRVFWF